MLHFLRWACLMLGSLICVPAVADESPLLLVIDVSSTPKHVGDHVNIYVTETNNSNEPFRIGPYLPDLTCPISVRDNQNIELLLTDQAKASRDGIQMLGIPGPQLPPGGVYKAVFDLGSYVRIERPGVYALQLSLGDPRGGRGPCTVTSNIVHFTVS